MSLQLNTHRPGSLSLLTGLWEEYQGVRQQSLKLCEPLEPEDFTIQTMDDVSPPKWHLAHSTWFFETFLLKPYQKNYQEFDPQFNYLFNSYYKGIGSHYPRPKRGLLSRPTISQIRDYRAHVDQCMGRFLASPRSEEVKRKIILGLNHEQQHQELLLTDIKHILATNPTHPQYLPTQVPNEDRSIELTFISFPERLFTMGFQGEGFSFDNELPPHKHFLKAYQMANRLVTNGEFLEFVLDGAYENPLLWLSDGWDWVQSHGIKQPLYWEHTTEGRFEHSLGGRRELHLATPVSHLTCYEADAFARWAGARLPTEAEWEQACNTTSQQGHFYDPKWLHPRPAEAKQGVTLQQMMGELWEWTASSYSPYPGFRPAPGAVGEYNGKFMVNQMVLRGGSCLTPHGHVRPTYRNFFPPHAAWQATGIRLAKDHS